MWDERYSSTHFIIGTRRRYGQLQVPAEVAHKKSLADLAYAISRLLRRTAIVRKFRGVTPIRNKLLAFVSAVSTVPTPGDGPLP